MYFNVNSKKVLTFSKYPDLRKRYLHMSLDTFFTTLYCLVDDWCKSCSYCSRSQARTGPPSRMSDSEVLTLVIAAQWRGGVPWQSERGMLRYLHAYGLKWFPTLLQQSQFNQRARQSGQRLCCFSKNWDIGSLAMRYMRWGIVRQCRTVACRKPRVTAAIGSSARRVVEAIMAAGITASNCCCAQPKRRHYWLVGGHCQHGRSLDAGSPFE